MRVSAGFLRSATSVMSNMCIGISVHGIYNVYGAVQTPDRGEIQRTQVTGHSVGQSRVKMIVNQSFDCRHSEEVLDRWSKYE